MSLQVILDSKEDIPEGLEDHYTEQDGKFVLDVDGVDDHPSVTGLKTSLAKQKKDNKELRAERDRIKDKVAVIPEEMDADALQAAIDNAGGEGDDKKAEQVRQRLQKDLEAKDAEIKQARQRFHSTLIDGSLRDALVANGVTTPGRQKGAASMLRNMIKAQENGDDVDVVVETDRGDVSVSDYVKQWVGTDEGKEYLPPSSGSGAPGSNGRGSAPKTITYEQYQSMTPEARHKAVMEDKVEIEG